MKLLYTTLIASAQVAILFASASPIPSQNVGHVDQPESKEFDRSTLVKRQNRRGGRGGDRAGANLKANPVAAKQDKADQVAKANSAATGGQGGVDPSTGEKLFALPAVSEFCKGLGGKNAMGRKSKEVTVHHFRKGKFPA